jgi:hypothetical protein
MIDANDSAEATVKDCEALPLILQLSRTVFLSLHLRRHSIATTPSACHRKNLSYSLAEQVRSHKLAAYWLIKTPYWTWSYTPDEYGNGGISLGCLAEQVPPTGAAAPAAGGPCRSVDQQADRRAQSDVGATVDRGGLNGSPELTTLLRSAATAPAANGWVAIDLGLC